MLQFFVVKGEHDQLAPLEMAGHMVNLERPDVFAGKEVLTDEEVADVEQQKARFDAADPKDRRDVNPGFFDQPEPDRPG